MFVDKDGAQSCDFCDLHLDEGEQFIEVRLGPLPQPRPITAQGITESDGWALDGKLRFEALKSALSDMEGIEFSVKDAVREVEPTVTAEFKPAEYEDEINHDKTAAEIRYHPDPIESEPDARLCPRCKELFE